MTKKRLSKEIVNILESNKEKILIEFVKLDKLFDDQKKNKKNVFMGRAFSLGSWFSMLIARKIINKLNRNYFYLLDTRVTPVCGGKYFMPDILIMKLRKMDNQGPNIKYYNHDKKFNNYLESSDRRDYKKPTRHYTAVAIIEIKIDLGWRRDKKIIVMNGKSGEYKFTIPFWFNGIKCYDENSEKKKLRWTDFVSIKNKNVVKLLVLGTELNTTTIVI